MSDISARDSDRESKSDDDGESENEGFASKYCEEVSVNPRMMILKISHATTRNFWLLLRSGKV